MDEATFKTVLLIEGDPEHTRVIAEMIAHLGSQAFDLVQRSSLGEGEAYLATHPVDVILLDMDSGGAVGQEAVRRVRLASPRVAIVLLFDPQDIGNAKQSMQDGAQDYLIRGEIEARELVRALENAIQRKIIEEALFEEKERAQVTLDSIGDAVISTDVDGKITFINLVAERLTGWSVPEASGQQMNAVFRIVDATTRQTIINPMEEAIPRNRVEHLPGNCILIRRDGQEVFIEDSAAPIHDRSGGVTGSVIVFRDVSTARALAEATVHASQHDFLTGLPNRLLLHDRLAQAIALARRRSSQLAVLFIDLDGFKHINDSLGHLVGDKLLQSIAQRLQHHLRTPDTVCRHGGDEFVLLLQDLREQEDAAITAKRIIDLISEVHSIGEHELHITASIGVSFYPEDGTDAETLMKNADIAMYQAKDHGRQCCKFFKPAMNVRTIDRQAIEEDLRHALERHELTLCYQPKIHLWTGDVIGVEALLRWNHTTRGPVPPASFISVAEDTGLILPIGVWVLREACKQARAWLDQGLPPTTMAINVSAVQLQDAKFLQEVLTVLAETGLDPHSLELELTESVLMRLPERTQSVLQQLREMGVVIALDDFGKGYSSLSSLKKLPIDTLKIDRSFIHQLNETADDAAIAVAIISMGRSLNLRVIAEGVESIEDVGFLKDHQCDEAQGFYFSQPLPAAEFADWLEDAFHSGASKATQSARPAPSLSRKAS